MKRILILGAGRVSSPCVDYLLEQPDLHVRVADADIDNARRVVGGHARGEAFAVDVDEDDPREEIAESDVVVNLLPKQYLSEIAAMCVQQKTSMIGATYVTDRMRSLHQQAAEAKVVIMGEVGLDPGIDHMMAAKEIDQLRKEGASVTGYRSLCGAVPSHKANDNPFGYKFSWSPSGALGAARRQARYLRDGREVEVPADQVMKQYCFSQVPGLGWFECYPNGDALPYRQLYGIEKVQDLYRGTYRYLGWCDTLAAMVELGLLDEAPVDSECATYRQMTAGLLGVDGSCDLTAQLASHLKLPRHSAVVKRIQWLGLTEERPLPSGISCPRDATGRLMLDRLQYHEGQRDMVVLTHQYTARLPGGEGQKISSVMVDYGEPGGASAIARTTGLPVAVVCLLVARGEVQLRGVHIPVHPTVYEPCLRELERLGITSRRRVQTYEQ